MLQKQRRWRREKMKERSVDSDSGDSSNGISKPGSHTWEAVIDKIGCAAWHWQQDGWPCEAKGGERARGARRASLFATAGQSVIRSRARWDDIACVDPDSRRA